MLTDYFKIMFLGMLADGEVHDAEKELILSLKARHPILKQITEEEIERATTEIGEKISGGMHHKYIIAEIGEQLSSREKACAYALAKEVCAADYKILPAENEFLNLIETTWNINKKTKEAVNLSIELRYSI